MEKDIKILLVDDESEFIEDMQARLLAKGWQVLTAGNRLQAEEVARHEKPDLIHNRLDLFKYALRKGIIVV